MKKGISTAVLLSALLLLTLAAVFLLQCFLGGMLFDWNYREPLLSSPAFLRDGAVGDFQDH